MEDAPTRDLHFRGHYDNRAFRLSKDQQSIVRVVEPVPLERALAGRGGNLRCDDIVVDGVIT